MDIKGACYFSKIHNQHIIIFLTNEDENGMALLVPLSSIKFNSNGTYLYNNERCDYYDDVCVLNINDIITDTGKSVLTKPTCVRYDKAAEMSVSDITSSHFQNQLEYRCIVDNKIFKRLQNGAKLSDNIPIYFQKYFELF